MCISELWHPTLHIRLRPASGVTLCCAPADNFYSPTVYEKVGCPFLVIRYSCHCVTFSLQMCFHVMQGAEVIRLYQTVLGVEGFR